MGSSGRDRTQCAESPRILQAPRDGASWASMASAAPAVSCVAWKFSSKHIQGVLYPYGNVRVRVMHDAMETYPDEHGGFVGAKVCKS